MKRKSSYDNTSTKRAKTGSDANDVASHHVYTRGHAPHNPARSFKAAFNRVSGSYYVFRPLTMRQSTINQYGVYTDDDQGVRMEFFTPSKFKNAEAVSFWGKTPSAVDFQTKTVTASGAGGNMATMQPVYVQFSAVNFKFRNVSQHNTTVEMYVCYGKRYDGYGTYPEADLDLCYDKLAGNYDGYSKATVMSNPLTIKHWTDLWDVQKHVFHFEPGEKAFTTLKGPTHYVMNAERHTAMTTTDTTSPVGWHSPNMKGNGCYVWMRVLNDLTLVSSSTGDTNANMGGKRVNQAHPVHYLGATDGTTPSGGVLCEIRETYVMKAPNGLNVQEAKNQYLGFKGCTGTLYDIQVDADASGDVPTAPL